MKTASKTILTAGDMSAASVTSSVFDTTRQFGYFFIANWTGTSPVGTLQVQASIDQITWVNYGSSVAVSGNTGAAIIENATSLAPYTQVIYTKTSGVGSVTINASTKGV